MCENGHGPLALRLPCVFWKRSGQNLQLAFIQAVWALLAQNKQTNKTSFLRIVSFLKMSLLG